MQQVFEQIHKAATVDDIPVLLQGETGTGKDLAAQAIHHLSDRRYGPYVPINMGAMPTELVNSELFGHERGAFTGAVVSQKGKFEQAKGGTLFLDEIESIDEKTQVNLLRVIEHQEFYRLGGQRQISTNAHLIAASNENLPQLVDQGIFRQDLFYRLEVFPIEMPPLRQRPEDLPLLIAHFVAHFNKLLQKTITAIDPNCLQMLEAYAWPGNVRELKNVIQRAVLVCEDTHTLCTEHFPSHLGTSTRPMPPVVSVKIGTPLEKVERSVILRTLRLVRNNRTKAAKLLGISRRALYNRLKRYRITYC
jgi:transcriptional regulator with PAS, ATPase and Fis domain